MGWWVFFWLHDLALVTGGWIVLRLGCQGARKEAERQVAALRREVASLRAVAPSPMLESLRTLVDWRNLQAGD